jgi:hypothetical protein
VRKIREYLKRAFTGVHSGMLWTGEALVVPTVEVISGQSEFMIPCTATAAADAVRSYYWLFNGTFVHVGAGTSVRADGGLQFSEIRPEQTGNRNLGSCRARVNLLKSPGIDSSPAGRYDNPICRTGPPGYILHRLAESIPGLLKRLQIRALVYTTEDCTQKDSIQEYKLVVALNRQCLSYK